MQLDLAFPAPRSLVQTYVATNKLPQALDQLQAQLAKDPKNASALLTLALLYERMENFPQARDAYEKVLSINPNFVPALNNLAYLDAERLNDLDKAYELARRARDLQGDDPAIAARLVGFFLSVAITSRPSQSCRRAPKNFQTTLKFNFIWA